MKEKHPDNEAQCIYCMTNQPHPRLARGEVYTCGYKPYRCEVRMMWGVNSRVDGVDGFGREIERVSLIGVFVLVVLHVYIM